MMTTPRKTYSAVILVKACLDGMFEHSTNARLRWHSSVKFTHSREVQLSMKDFTEKYGGP